MEISNPLFLSVVEKVNIIKNSFERTLRIIKNDEKAIFSPENVNFQISSGYNTNNYSKYINAANKISSELYSMAPKTMDGAPDFKSIEGRLGNHISNQTFKLYQLIKNQAAQTEIDRQFKIFYEAAQRGYIMIIR